MRRLVWKFWLAIWVAVISMLAASLLIISQWQRFESYSQAQARPHAMLQQLANRIENELRADLDVSALLLNNEMSKFGTVYLVNPSGADILSRPIPSAIRNGKPALSQPHVVSVRAPVFARAIKVPGAQTLFMIFQFGTDTNPMWLLFQRIGLSWVLLASMLIAGLISTWLALIVVRPLNQLAAASARQHYIDHDMPLANKLLQRRDEIGDLARQLKASAAQTRQTIQRQKEFIRDVSHEVRTPLARLQVASESVLLDSTDTRALMQIEQEVSTIDQLVHDLLQLSKSDATNASDQFADVELNKILHECHTNLVAASRAKNISIINENGNTDFNLPGDPRLLARLFENILSNAIRHAPHHSTISIRTSTSSDSCKVRIRDRGPGVSPENLESIFQPFVRLDKARRRDTGGFGIGLALVKKIVEVHRGHVCAHNDPVQGLSVDVYLPLVRNVCAV